MSRNVLGLTQEFHEHLAGAGIYLSTTGKPRQVRHVVVEDAARIEPYTGIYAGTALCTMGAFSYTRSGLKPEVRIGRYCSIANGLVIAGARHPIEWVTSSNIAYERNGQLATKFFSQEGNQDIPYRSPVGMAKGMPIIGNDVWIAQNVTLNQGVTIGDGAVIAAGAVVTKDVAPYAIVGGNKANLIRNRFQPEQIQALQALKWWDYDPAIVLKLEIADVDQFIKSFSKLLPNLEPYTPKVATGREISDYHRLTAPVSVNQQTSATKKLTTTDGTSLSVRAARKLKRIWRKLS